MAKVMVSCAARSNAEEVAKISRMLGLKSVERTTIPGGVEVEHG
jgi:hypothetical protein